MTENFGVFLGITLKQIFIYQIFSYHIFIWQHTTVVCVLQNISNSKHFDEFSWLFLLTCIFCQYIQGPQEWIQLPRPIKRMGESYRIIVSRISKYTIYSFLLWKKELHILRIQGLLGHRAQIQIFTVDLPALYKTFNVWCFWEDVALSNFRIVFFFSSNKIWNFFDLFLWRKKLENYLKGL